MMILYYTLRTVHDVPYHFAFSYLFNDLTRLYVHGVQLRAPTQTALRELFPSPNNSELLICNILDSDDNAEGSSSMRALLPSPNGSAMGLLAHSYRQEVHQV
jgi:hypothetical protein